MTITPKRLADAAGRLAEAAGAVVGEQRAVLEFTGRFATPEDLEEWRALCHGAAAIGCSIAVRDTFDSFVDVSALNAADAEGQEFYIRVTKPTLDGVSCFFTADGFDRFLAMQVGVSGICAVAGDVVPFSSTALDVVEWNDLPAPTELIEHRHWDQPRKFVRDLAGDLVPASLAAWLPRKLPDGTCPAFECWRRTSASHLLMSLPNEAWRQDGEAWVAVKGPRTVKIPVGNFGAFPLDDAYAALVRAAEWVYGTQTDAEIKHTLLSNELARDWPDSAPWAETVARRLDAALTHAQDAYRLHVQGTSKDTLKSLGDLRKALNDETDKVAAQTRELISGLWKDFAVAVAALGFRYATFSGTTATPTWANTLMIGTGLFLAFSFGITVNTNRRIHKVAAASRTKWRERLYSFLGEQDFEDMAAQPIRDVMSAYRSTRFWVGLAYAVVVFVLVGVGLDGLGMLQPMGPWATAVIRFLFPP
ncbi:hypothetical protein [Azospirillum argentinense]|uniref:Uncharacterized protein n=1 Tax=Azospirillum argentinense TaxID=2970906 RepID=A0A5B0KQV8_9PROT|nr:hypothetical protein [Azospirillum argentinense]KAA1053164.1 hypothetical protein FH063_003083 [Azospirillum argentinense]